MRRLRAAVDLARVFSPGAFSTKGPAANENGGLQCRGPHGLPSPPKSCHRWALLSVRDCRFRL